MKHIKTYNDYIAEGNNVNALRVKLNQLYKLKESEQTSKYDKEISELSSKINKMVGTIKESESIDEANVNYSFLTDRRSLDYIKSKGVEDTGDFIDFLRGTIEDNLEDDPGQYSAVILKYYFDNKKEMDVYLKDFVAHVQGK